MCPDDTGVFCNYFMIESQLDNKIGLEVDASLLILALKSSEASEQTVIKLRKRDGQAFLSFEIITNVPLPPHALPYPPSSTHTLQHRHTPTPRAGKLV